MKSNEEIQAKHERAVKSPYLQTSHLDKQDLDEYGHLSPVSAIVPTFNRCPNSAEEDSNPLGWCLESLLAQEGPGLAEIVVVDDASEDHTEEVIDRFSGISEIPIVYVQNKKNLGSSLTKNIGVENSNNDLVLFLDDDCIFSKYLFFGASYTFDRLGSSAGALHLPVYQRKTTPDPMKMSEIGVFDANAGTILGNHNGLPIEYSKDLNQSFMGGDLKILKPMEISTLAGIFISSKKILEKVGGYPEFFTWSNGYREETHLGLEMQRAGYGLFFTPDPKFYCVHLKYGAHGQESKYLDLDPQLGRLVTASNMAHEHTGNRVDPEEWFFSRIISTYVTLGIRNSDAATRYLQETHKEFVENNDLSMSGVNGVKINNIGDRRRIFERAVDEGSKLIKRYNPVAAQLT